MGSNRSGRRAVATAMVAVLALLGGGCGADDVTEPADDGPRGATGAVRVFAAASLTDAFARVEEAFEAAHPGADVQLNLAGSSALREQLLEGAPADVFASANARTMDQVVEAGAVPGPVRTFARNALAIAVPKGNPGRVRGLEDLADRDRLIGLCAEGVPCGDAARQVLASAGVEASVDTNEADVRALLTKITAGELDAGLVYVTDVMAAGDAAEAITIPDEVNVVADYVMAELRDAPNPEGAAAFVAFVTSPEGQVLLEAAGFQPA